MLYLENLNLWNLYYNVYEHFLTTVHSMAKKLLLIFYLLYCSALSLISIYCSEIQSHLLFNGKCIITWSSDKNATPAS